jgi:hypothetical protein
MKPAPSLTRADFDGLVADHARLIGLMNDLEYHLYALGERPPEDPVAACQRAAGSLLGALREVLFRHDQQVLPVLESVLQPE